MSGKPQLAGRMLETFRRVERDLALLYADGYFTNEQWIQMDFLIHKGQYIFTDGPQRKPLIDFFGPLETRFTGGETDLLLPTKAVLALSYSGEKFDDSDDTAVGSPILEPEVEGRGPIGYAKRKSDAAVKTRAENCENLQDIAQRAVASFKEAGIDRRRVLQAIEDHEQTAAAEWEMDEETKSQGAIKAKDYGSTSCVPSSIAAEAVAAIQSEINETVESRVKEILEKRPVCGHWVTPGLICRYGSKCVKLHPPVDTGLNPPTPTSRTSASSLSNTNWRTERQGNRTANYPAPWSRNEKRKGAGVAKYQAKDLTCYWWAKNGRCESGDLCVNSHYDTGTPGPVPFWERSKIAARNGSDVKSEEQTAPTSTNANDENDDDDNDNDDNDDNDDVSDDGEHSGSNNTSPGAAATSTNRTVLASSPRPQKSASRDLNQELGSVSDLEYDCDNPSSSKRNETDLSIDLFPSNSDSKIDWADEVNELAIAMEQAENNKNNYVTGMADMVREPNPMILGAAAGGWGDANMELMEDEGEGEWKSVVGGRKKKTVRENGW